MIVTATQACDASAKMPNGGAGRKADAEFELPDHIRLAHTSAGAVFLDLHSNRYLGVGRRESEALQLLLPQTVRRQSRPDGEPAPMTVPEAVEITQQLAKRNLLARRSSSASCLAPQQRDDPTHDCVHGPLEMLPADLAGEPGFRYSDIVEFSRASHWAHRAIKDTALLDVARQLREFNCAARFAHQQQRSRSAASCVASFRRLRPWSFAAKDQCLFHSLALLRFLTLHGICATWVIGVRTTPWNAHSWVQLGRMVLDGTPESVYDYAPMVIV